MDAIKRVCHCLRLKLDALVCVAFDDLPAAVCEGIDNVFGQPLTRFESGRASRLKSAIETSAGPLTLEPRDQSLVARRWVDIHPYNDVG